MAERTESIVLDFEVDFDTSVESIDNLTKANKRLREERKKLDTATEEGRKQIERINAQLDKNSEKIKNNSSAVEKQRANIGNYKSALDGVHPALGKVGEGLEQGASGFKAMTLQALRFIATPIGAILAALVTVFTLLKTAISTNNEVLDKFENITTAIGQVMTILINRVGKLGEALIAFVSLDFDKAVELTGEAFGGLADEISRAVGEGQVLLEMSRDLEDAQRQLRIEQAKQENVIKALVVAAKNRNLTLDQQEGKLKEALRLEQNLVAERERLAQQELEIATRRIANDENIQKSSEETFQQFAERLIKNGELGDEQVDGLIEQIEKLEQARGSSLAFQEKVENSLSAIQEKRAAALEKQNAALAEQAALERANRRAQNEIDGTTEDPLQDAFPDRLNRELQLTEDFNRRIARMQKEGADEAIRQKRREAEARIALEKHVNDATIDLAVGFLDVAASLFDEQSEEYKALATFQTLISTYSAAQKAYEAAFLPIPTVASPGLGVAYAALAVAQGLARVAQINGVEFAEGGWTGPGDKYKPVGVVHADEYVTPKWLVHSPKAQPHLNALENMRQRGYGYFDGGLAVNTATQPINQSFDVMNLIKRMPAPVVSVKEINTEQRRVRVKEKISKR